MYSINRTNRTNRIIVSVFNNESEAFEALVALKALHMDGDISIHATAVIGKNESGEAEMKDATGSGPIGVSVGLLSGTILGILGGPAGVVIGAAVGAFGGMVYDLNKSNVNIEFANDVALLMEKGKTALIADIEEGWSLPVDIVMENIGGITLRIDREDVIDVQLMEEELAMEREIEALEAELDQAGDEITEDVQRRLDKLKEKRAAFKDAVGEKLEALKKEKEEKRKELKTGVQTIKDELSERKESMNADYLQLKEKVKSNRELLKASFEKKMDDFKFSTKKKLDGLNDDIKSFEEKLKSSHENAKEALQAKIDDAKQKRATIMESTQEKMNSLKVAMDERIKNINNRFKGEQESEIVEGVAPVEDEKQEVTEDSAKTTTVE